MDRGADYCAAHHVSMCRLCANENPAATPQPAPVPGQTEVTPLVIADLEARRAFGLRKYGTPLMVENRRDHMMDAWQEILDFVVYYKCALVQQARVWQMLDELYALALRAENADPELLTPITEKLAVLMQQRPTV